MEHKIQILVVEDEAIIAEALRGTLEDFDFDVVDIAYNYEEAIAYIEQYEFDLLLLDINLGANYNQAGLDIAAKLQSLKKVPFIFLTAFSDQATITKAAKLKPSAYLIKPASMPSIFAAIQTALENYDSNTEATPPSENQKAVEYFFVKDGSKRKKVYWSDIYAISSMKNYVKFLTPQNPSGYLMRTSLNHTLRHLIPISFGNKYIQINRGTIIDKDIIKSVGIDKVDTIYGEFDCTHNFTHHLINAN